MNELQNWALRWNLPPQAVQEFNNIFGIGSYESNYETGEGESMVQSRIRLESSQCGARVWRNNSGAYTDDYGNFIRYGLANDSKKLNQQIKSSDLIGLKPVTITLAHVGSIIGQFVAREVKKSDWKFSINNPKDKAQLNFINVVNSLGGDACFAQGPGTFK